MSLHLNIAIVAAVTCASGYLMIVAGLHKNMLELRRPKRTCPSCGRHMNERVCSACASSS
jgi:recombinational DNA repair protein RecR